MINARINLLLNIKHFKEVMLSLKTEMENITNFLQSLNGSPITANQLKGLFDKATLIMQQTFK